MKNTIKMTLALALFAGIAVADDGNQGTGGRTCNPLTDPSCHTGAAQNNNSGIQTGETGEITIEDIVVGVIEGTTLILLG